jgi:hypothetical protein
MAFALWTAISAVLAALLGIFRPWHLRWGTTDQEVTRQMPGDEIVRRPVFNATRAVTVNARPEEIWPWLVQIGYGRAGWYSYDLLDNLGRHSSEQILPEHQQLEPGDLVPLGPGEQSGMWVKSTRPYESMVWWDRKRQASSWTWGLYPVDSEHTRLVTRVRNDYRKSMSAMLFGLLVELADFPMMRRCMLGIKRRAEQQATTAPAGQQQSGLETYFSPNVSLTGGTHGSSLSFQLIPGL